MAGDDDFEYVRAKVPTRDKDGNRITSNDLGSGGARRDDGTISAMAYDLEYLSDGDGMSPGGDGTGRTRAYDADRLNDDDADARAEQWVEFFTVLLRDAAIPLAKAAAPHVKDWFADSARPAIRRRTNSLTRRLRRQKEETDALAASVARVERKEREHAETAVEVTSVGPTISMTSEDWRSVFGAWQKAQVLEEALRRLLASAHVEDGDEALWALQAALQELSPQQRSAIAARMLETSIGLPDDEMLVRLSRVFGEDAIINGRIVAVPRQVTSEAPASADGEG